jgi:hypothetical protein
MYTFCRAEASAAGGTPHSESQLLCLLDNDRLRLYVKGGTGKKCVAVVHRLYVKGGKGKKWVAVVHRLRSFTIASGLYDPRWT